MTLGHGEPLFDLQNVFEVDDYLYFYGDSLTDERSDAQIAALVHLLELDAPMKILDLACGFGRHANRLASLGHAVTGIDLLDGFLKIARRDAAARNVCVDYRQGDMRLIDFQESYDRVLLLFTALGYFDDEGNALVLRNIARALKPGGLVLFDIPNRDTAVKTLLPAIVTEKEGNLLIDRITFDTATGRLHNRRIVIRDGVRRDKPFSVRYFNATEIRDLLLGAGLRLARLYGDWDGQPLTAESRRMIVIGEKPRT